MPRLLLLSFAALALAGCGQQTSERWAVRTSAATLKAGLGDTSIFSAEGPRWWMDGPRWWMDGPRWWMDGPRWWMDGPRWWMDGVFELMPANSAAFRLVKLDAAHAVATRMGEGVTVAVIDSGIDPAHPMLSGALLVGRDFVDNDDDPSERGSEVDLAYGHGTAVAGVIRQVAPGARILPLRVLSADGTGDASHVAGAIRHAVDAGARIINLSISAPASSEGTRAALQYAAHRGVLVVAASGNDGAERAQSPASFLDARSPLGQYGASVSAVDASGVLPDWSNRGGETRAPGVRLDTAYPGGRVVAATGSSFSTPVVSGALALALSQGRSARELAAGLTGGSLLNAEALLD